MISLLRTLAMYAAVLVSVRVMGKRQISQLQTSELAVTLLISELAVLPIQEHRQPLWDGVVPMAALVLCEVAVALGMLKSGLFRRLVCGRPVLVIEHGAVLQDQMTRLRMSTEDLFEQLRLNGVFSLEEVDYAIIETNGMMSVRRRPQCDPLTPGQAGVPVAPAPLEVVVVSDGRISRHSLRLCGKDEDWVRRETAAAGLPLSQVFLMTADRSGVRRVVPKS